MLLVAVVDGPADTVERTVETGSAPAVLLVALIAGLVGLLVAVLVGFVVRRAARRSPVARQLSRRGRAPLRVSMVLLGVLVVLVARPGEDAWRAVAQRLVVLALIGSVAWLVAALAFVAEDAALSRFRTDVRDGATNRTNRRVRTQVVILRRLTVAVVALLAVAGMLLTFPAARTAGASIVASAGVLGIILGLAAQSTLGTTVAGFQIAFTGSVRVDDVVVVEGEWGRVEDVTLTNVVVHIWDDRRLILPTTYFTSTPFENWTRREPALIGAVEMDLDWSVPVEALRTELRRVVEGTDLWDGRVVVLQVTDAVHHTVRVRALVSGADGPTVFDLRCHVREALVGWLQRDHPEALPRWRLQDEPPRRTEPTRTGLSTETDTNLFRGSSDAEERSRQFSGPPTGSVAVIRPDPADRPAGGAGRGGGIRGR